MMLVVLTGCPEARFRNSAIDRSRRHTVPWLEKEVNEHRTAGAQSHVGDPDPDFWCYSGSASTNSCLGSAA